MKERKKYPLELIWTSFHQNLNGKGKRFLENEAMRAIQPYCIQQLKNSFWIPLNRDYKPLGLRREGWATYEDYDFLFLEEKEINFEYLWDNGIAFGSRAFYFFSDSTNPLIDKKNWNRYTMLLLDAFFERQFPVKTIYSFKQLWGYKEKLSPNDFQKNIERFA